MTKVSMIIMSHLSDAQELNGITGKAANLHTHINFAKWLVLKYKNTETEIDPIIEWNLFKHKFGG